MKAKLGLLDRVREARRRLRDSAAGTFAEAEAEHTLATERHTAAEAGLDEVHDAAATRLASTRTVRELLVLDHERRMAINLLADAKQEVVVARAESDRRRARLQQHARELRVAEKVIDKTRALVAADEKRAEQRSSDDLAAARRPRDEA